MKSGEYNKLRFGKPEFDALFDIYLKPMRSKNSRTIFKILADDRKVGSLTTLDIQTKLDDIGIRLSKKEINGWLHSLLTAGLVSKDEERGKPTIVDYTDRYTFDLWRLTDLGAKIADRLPNVLGTKLALLEGDIGKLLKDLARIERDRRSKILRNLDELNMLVKMLLKLLENEGELNKANLIKKFEVSENELDRLLSKYSNQGSGLTLIFQKQRQHSIKTILLSLLGLASRKDARIALTEEGRKIAETLHSSEPIG